MGVQKVVERCEVAKENGGIMDLSGCHLFHDERHTINCLQSLVKCYHQNSTQIPKQFQLYHRIELISQQNVNIARRDFQMYSTGNCGHFKKFIAEVDIDLLTTCDGSSTLETLNLEENPLSRDCQDNLGTINSIRISITPREMEEWEDLSI